METLAEGLPYEALRWEDFERLCLRYARTESDIEHADQYGERGQDQAGIDLYARLGNGEYRVYQCKNEREFGPAKIRAAVQKFLAGEWAGRARELVLCTRESLRATKRSDEFEKQATLLKERGITLTAWDAGALNELLKEQQELVDDFFGRQWVKRFCGDDAANRLGERLDSSEVQAFRIKLRAFYSNLFLLHDRGLPSAAFRTGVPLSVYQRYVIPWIYQPQQSDSAPAESSFSPPTGVRTPTDENRFSPSRVPRQASRRQRVSLESWLLGAQRVIVVADFGLGKTSLLRFLALDLMDDSPKLSRLAMQWGGRLPVWVPFALWTRLIADPKSADASLSDVLRKWLHSQDEERLWPLVERALHDERLLLLVDGLDEWSTPTAANIAGQRLALFAGQRGLPVVAVGRPTGVSGLSLSAQDWPVGELADFDQIQQRELSTQWIEHWIRCESDGIDPGELGLRARSKVNELMQELSSPELAELAKVPLLLSLLILLKLNNTTLPDDRFKAYDELLRHLITVHPQRRREVAGVGESTGLAAEDASRVLAHLAFIVQRDHSEGTIERGKAITIVEGYLKSDEGLGFDTVAARRYARELVETEGASTGLLVRRSELEIGFFHRSLQEYLAAQHLSRLPLEAQLRVVREYIQDATWHEVLLGLLRLSSRRDDVQRYVDAMERAQLNPVERLNLEILLTEAAVGDYNLPPSVARRLLDTAIRTIETGPWLPHRERLLSKLLSGLRQSATSDRIRGKVMQWFPSIPWRRSLYGAVAKWDRGEDVLESLWRGLYDEEFGNQRAAASAIVQLAAGETDVGNKLAHICRFNQNHLARVAAFEALIRGWPTHNDLRLAIAGAITSPSPELRFVAVACKIVHGEQTLEDQRLLLHLGTLRSTLNYELRGDIPKLLAEGWSHSSILRSECLAALHSNQPRVLDHNLALEALLRAFPDDPEVAAFLRQRIETERCPFVGVSGHLLGWQLLAANFKASEVIHGAIDVWMAREQGMDSEIAFASLVGRTPKAKAILLASLRSSEGFIHWQASALLEGWGITDPETRESLQLLARDPATGGRIAHLLPRIIEDRTQCAEILMSMLADEKGPRPDFVISGLQSIDSALGNQEACTLALSRLSGARGIRSEELVGQIIVAFADDPRARSLAISELGRAEGNSSAVALAFGTDPEIRSLILARLSPLPTRLRDSIVNALADRPAGDHFATSRLHLYAQEDDPEVRTKASIAFHRRLVESGGETSGAVATLVEEIVAFGVNQSSCRQAALCGLIELGRIDAFRDAIENAGVIRNAVVPFDGFTVNYSLLHCVGRHWAKLRDVIGAELENRFVDYASSRNGLPWHVLSIVAAEYPPLAHELISVLESPAAPPITANILRFLASLRPKSLLLRKTCLDVIRNHNRQSLRDDAEPVAAELLAAQFRDDETFAEILTVVPEGFQWTGSAYGQLLALADAWPDSDAVKRAKQQLSGQLVKWDLYFALGEDNTRRFIEALRQLCRIGGPFDAGTSRRIFKSCVRDITHHDQSYQVLLGHYLREIDDALRVSAPALLATSRGVGLLGRHQLMARLELELSGKTEPHVGYDLRLDQIRSESLALFDILTAGEARGTS